MEKRDKNRLLLIGAVIVLGVILWLLLGGSEKVKRIIEQGGDLNVPAFGSGVGKHSPRDIPSLDYKAGSFNYVGGSKGCLLCYSGYTRIAPPAAPAPAPAPIPPATIINYYPDPKPEPVMTFYRSAGW